MMRFMVSDVRNRVVNFLALLVLIVPSVIEVSAASPVAANSTPAMCAADQLAIALLPVSHGAPTLGYKVIYLPIRITNTGPTCSLGGIPRIKPLGVHPKSGVEIKALPTSMKFKNLILKRSQSAYTVLGYWWTPATFKTYRSRWLKSCAPKKATAFEITIPLEHKWLTRKLMYTLPEVCTKGKANMSITPLSRTLF